VTALRLSDRWDAVMMPNYGTPPIALDRGAGVRVWDTDGREYLDLVGGIAVSSLGHAHPAIVAAVTDQIGRLAHPSHPASPQPHRVVLCPHRRKTLHRSACR